MKPKNDRIGKKARQPIDLHQDRPLAAHHASVSSDDGSIQGKPSRQKPSGQNGGALGAVGADSFVGAEGKKQTKAVALNPKKFLHDVLRDLQKIEKVLYQRRISADPADAVFATARSTKTPDGDGFSNGAKDYEFTVELGKAFAELGATLRTGAGDGGMAGPMEGSQEIDKDESKRQGVKIFIHHEKKLNQFIAEKMSVEVETFLVRILGLIDGTRAVVSTPGGFGTIAEYFEAMAQKTLGIRDNNLFFAAVDDFFDVINAAFAPFVSLAEAGNFWNHTNDPTQAAHFVVAHARVPASEVSVRKLMRDVKNDMGKVMKMIAHKPPAFSFIAGEGNRSKKAAEGMAEIAALVAKESDAPVRVGGSPVVDVAVRDSIMGLHEKREMQAFRMTPNDPGNPAQFIAPGFAAQELQHTLVMRQAMTTHARGVVVVPDGSASLSTLMNLLVDMQTGKAPVVPVVVFDPDNQFGHVRDLLKEMLHSKTRRYIDEKDIELFSVTNDPKEAARILLGERVHTTLR